MKEIVIASGNIGKIKEAQEILKDYRIVSIEEMGMNIEVEEDQKTLEGNAIKKAETIAKALNGKMCIADDSGIEIEYLDGFPGVLTKRWHKGTDRERNLALIEKLKGIPKEKRKITFTTAIALSDGKNTICELGKIEGYVAEKIRGENGFGFDEIFELENGKTLAEISEEEKNKISARKIALEKIRNKLNKLYNMEKKMKSNTFKYIGKEVNVIVDRPLGSSHPNYPESIYMVNYGYVPNTLSGDGEELDCFILGEYKPLKEYKGECIAVIHRKEDDDDKLIVVPKGKTFTNKEIRVLTDFQERYFQSEIIRNPEYLEFNKNIPELSVTNLNNSLNFYKCIGFKVEYERPENKFVFLSLGEIQFMLQEISDNDKWDVAPLSYPFGNGINFQLEVDDVNKIYDSLKENNYKIAFEIEENWYRQGDKLLGNKEFLIQDPDGYLLRFSEDLGEKH